MTLAASCAGMGFGNAGVHLAHGCSYAISGLNPGWSPPTGYPAAPLVPHGVSVVLSAPAVFQATAAACPERHMEAAKILRGDNPPAVVSMYTSRRSEERRTDADVATAAGAAIADQLRQLMSVMDVPDGLSALGYTSADVPALVAATLPQRRVLALAPSAENADEEHLTAIFTNSLKCY